jgi:hypothetical protein
MIVIGWLLKYPTNIIVQEVCVNRKTVGTILRHCRDLIAVWLMENQERIGGPGHIVEIDESAFGKRKYNRGRLRPTRWVVGGIDRATKKSFLKLVTHRNAATLEDITVEFVEQGTTIMTDCWRGYRNLRNRGFIHHAVNHSINFVDPNNREVHTQNIEAYWSKIKRDLRRRIGRMSVENTETYLIEYIWRSKFNDNQGLFIDFINAINYFYPQ